MKKKKKNSPIIAPGSCALSASNCSVSLPVNPDSRRTAANRGTGLHVRPDISIFAPPAAAFLPREFIESNGPFFSFEVGEVKKDTLCKNGLGSRKVQT